MGKTYTLVEIVDDRVIESTISDIEITSSILATSSCTNSIERIKTSLEQTEGLDGKLLIVENTGD